MIVVPLTDECNHSLRRVLRLVGTPQKRLPDKMESAERKQQKSSRR